MYVTLKIYTHIFLDVVKSAINVNLYFPDLAIDGNGNRGFWTMIYNQVCSTYTSSNWMFQYRYNPCICINNAEVQSYHKALQ